MNHEKRANNKDVLAEAGVEETSAVKKRQCIGPSAKASIEKASGDTETWHHQLDAELPKRQTSAVQLHCEADESSQKHLLVVSDIPPFFQSEIITTTTTTTPTTTTTTNVNVQASATSMTTKRMQMSRRNPTSITEPHPKQQTLMGSTTSN